MPVQTKVYDSASNTNQYIISNTNESLIVKVIEYGATITNIHFNDNNGKLRDVVLGFNDIEGYYGKKVENPFFGAAIGRAANRIAKGKFSLNEKTYELPINNDPNSLHGGNNGFDKKKWTLIKCTENAITLQVISEDGDEGFPGKLKADITYTVTDDKELKIEYSAELIDNDANDLETIVNLTNHTYFNLNGCSTKEGVSIRNHTMIFEPSHFLQVNDDLIPTGKILSTKSDDPMMDFTKIENPHTIGERIDSVKPNGYNHCYVIETNEEKYKIEGGNDLRTVVTAHSPLTGITMTMLTTEPAFQFYTGNNLTTELYTKSSQTCHWPKIALSKNSGFCLETQRFPNAINNEKWKNQVILKNGKKYAHKTIYKFAN